MTRSAATRSFLRIPVRVADAAAAEQVAAEAYAAGAVGLEEREEGGRLTLVLYAPDAGAAEAVGRAVRESGLAQALGEAEPVPAVDWPELWKRDLEATPISERLLVRPSFVPSTAAGGQAEVVIDPGQAFGTGAHESTRLALEWVDAVADGLPAGARVLDVGCGSGVLALAALRRGASRAVACDLDPLAVEATRENAQANHLSGRVRVFRGSVEAAAEEGFDLVVANLLRSELEPLLPALARRVRPAGRAIVSGLLDTEAARVEAGLSAAGLSPVARRERRDASGELWCAWLTRR